jgi:hypothetical protein
MVAAVGVLRTFETPVDRLSDDHYGAVCGTTVVILGVGRAINVPYTLLGHLPRGPRHLPRRGPLLLFTQARRRRGVRRSPAGLLPDQLVPQVPQPELVPHEDYGLLDAHALLTKPLVRLAMEEDSGVVLGQTKTANVPWIRAIPRTCTGCPRLRRPAREEGTLNLVGCTSTEGRVTPTHHEEYCASRVCRRDRGTL